MCKGKETIDCLGAVHHCWKCDVIISVGAFCPTCSQAIAVRKAEREAAAVKPVEGGGRWVSFDPSFED